MRGCLYDIIGILYMKYSYKKAMIFGVFDRLHPGHIFLINKAKDYAENLVIVLAQNKSVINIKGYSPTLSIVERKKEIKKKFPNTKIIYGDKNKGSWNVIKKEKPDVIILGYDQKKLFQELKKEKAKYNFKLKMIKDDYKGEILHSSLMK